MQGAEIEDGRRSAGRVWRSARNSLLAAWSHSTTGKAVVLLGALLSLAGMLQISGMVAAMRPRAGMTGDLQQRWVGIPKAREGALATQARIWGALGVDSNNKEGREYGSSVSSQQIMYLLDAVKAGTVCEIGECVRALLRALAPLTPAAPPIADVQGSTLA